MTIPPLADSSCQLTWRTHHNPSRPLIDDLDRIPPFPYHLFADHVKEYDSFGVVVGSRGCPYNCIFCSSRSVSGRRYRYHSVERVLNEIGVLIEQYGQREIHLTDDNLAVNQKRFVNLMDQIMAKGYHHKASFYGSMRGDNVSEEILDKAKACNFSQIAFGLETGSERLMKMLCKGETVKTVADAVCLTASKGLTPAVTIIFGLPGESIGVSPRNRTLQVQG